MFKQALNTSVYMKICFVLTLYFVSGMVQP